MRTNKDPTQQQHSGSEELDPDPACGQTPLPIVAGPVQIRRRWTGNSKKQTCEKVPKLGIADIAARNLRAAVRPRHALEHADPVRVVLQDLADSCSDGIGILKFEN